MPRALITLVEQLAIGSVPILPGPGGGIDGHPPPASSRLPAGAQTPQKKLLANPHLGGGASAGAGVLERAKIIRGMNKIEINIFTFNALSEVYHCRNTAEFRFWLC